MRNRRVLPLAILLLLASAAAGASFSVQQQSDWNSGTFSSTEASNGALQVQDGQSSGTYTSSTFNAGDNYTWESLEVKTELNGGSATATMETSRDDFSTVRERATFTASGGVESFDFSSLDETRYVRFNYSLTGGAKVNSTNVTIGDSTSFIIRSGACQSDETELFSMNGRTDAHAGDPGYRSHAICGTGFDQRHYTQTCDDDETAVLSFNGSQVQGIHLSTDPDQFSYNLCTRTLGVGKRSSCPAATRAIVSLNSQGTRIGEPGNYANQLCGAFFQSVTAELSFHLGPETTVHINRTENPSQGLYSDPDGRESWYATSENGTVLTGIVSGEDTVSTAVGYEERGENTVFNMTQERGSSSYLLPFTTGDAGDVEDRISLIEGGEFFSQLNPNFGFALAEKMTVRLTLRLSEVDIISDTILSPGSHNIIIENFGENSEGNAKVGVNVTR